MAGSAKSPAASERPSMSGLSARKEEFVYRPVSLMAVLSLVASLFSLFSFVSMFVIPIAFIFLIASIITYVRLERARNEYAGQLLAGLAIFISLIGTLGAGTVHAVTFFALSAEARQQADEYLQALLSDKLEDAFRMRMDPQSRASVGDDINDLVKTYNKKLREIQNGTRDENASRRWGEFGDRISWRYGIHSVPRHESRGSPLSRSTRGRAQENV